MTNEDPTRAPTSCVGGCFVVLLTFLGAILGAIVGAARAHYDGLFALGDLEVLGYAVLGSLIGLGVGAAIFVAHSRQ